MVNISIEAQPLSRCVHGDLNRDGQITVEEIVIAVNAGLSGCPVAPLICP